MLSAANTSQDSLSTNGQMAFLRRLTADDPESETIRFYLDEADFRPAHWFGFFGQ